MAKLAERLVRANAQAERADIVEAAAQLEGSAEGDDEAPGVLDRIAQTETTLPKWKATIDGLVGEIQNIGEAMAKATRDIERGETQGKGLAARLTIARQVAQTLEEPTSRFYSLANRFAMELLG